MGFMLPLFYRLNIIFTRFTFTGIDALLKWILANKSKVLMNAPQNQMLSKEEKLLKPDFICWRGLLTTLLVTPYDNQKEWLFSVIKYRGTLYLCELETEKNKFERVNMDEKSKSFTYWGHKFESYITADLPDEVPNGADDIPDPECNFGTVIASKLNEHNLFYAAEIDACFQSEHKSLSDYCEIKTQFGKNLEDLNFGK
jgi:RAT1-interacting protein